MTGLPHAKRPCGECPWRRDQPVGRFPASRYEALRATAGAPGEEVGFGAPMFACHKSGEGTDIVCAGWLAVVGYYHLGVRLAVATGRLPRGALECGEDWPDLFGNYDTMAAANGA